MNISKISHGSIKRYKADPNFNQVLGTPGNSGRHSRQASNNSASPKPDKKMKFSWREGQSDRNSSKTRKLMDQEMKSKNEKEIHENTSINSKQAIKKSASPKPNRKMKLKWKEEDKEGNPSKTVEVSD